MARQKSCHPRRGILMRSAAARAAAATMAAGLFVLVAWSTRSLLAQGESWTTPYRMLLTPERALAFVRAADRKLLHVPGEVLVRFRDGVSVAGQQRALEALGSQPPVSDLRWV